MKQSYKIFKLGKQAVSASFSTSSITNFSVCTFLTLFSSSSLSHAQTTYEVIANFHTGYNSPQNILVVYGLPGTTGTISNNAGYMETFTVGSTGVFQIVAPVADVTMSPTPANNISQKSLLISADSPISASALIRENATSDMTGLLTSDGWDDNYYVLSHPPTILTSQLTVTASEDATTVNITSPVNYDDLVANTQSSFTLNAGESLSLSGPAGVDISGAHITSDKAIAVFTGNKCSNAYDGACDTMLTQNWGVDNFATDYRITTTFGGTSTNGDAVRIVASQDGTTVSLDGTQVATLDAGDVHVIDDVRNSHITSSLPIQIVQVMKGGRSTGDPAMSFIPASTQWLSDYVFATPEGDLALASNYLAIGINQSDFSSLTLNGSSVSVGDFAEYTLEDDFVYGNLAIDAGIGTIRAANPFLAMLTGFDSFDSFYGTLATTFSEGVSDPVLDFFSTADQIAQVNQVNNGGGTPPPSTRDIDQLGDIISNLVDMSGSALNSVFDGGELIVDQNLGAGDVASFAIKAGNGNATLNVASGDDHSVGSKFTDNSGDAGVLEKEGAGTLVLTNTANDYTGGTVVSAGTLEVASDSVLGATSGGVTLNGGTLATTADMSSARAVSLGASNGTVDTATATTLTLSGVVAGSGSLTKTGAGNLTVTGTNTYTGATTVSAGTLDLDGSLASDVTVASGARIEGSGSAAGDLTSYGTVAPGNSPGTLSFGGDVDFASGNTFITELDGLTYNASGGAGSYDRLAVTGASSTFSSGGNLTAVLPGIATPTFVPAIGDAFRVVTTANATGVSGVSGAFSSVTDPTSGMPTNTRFDVLYGGNYVDLVLTPDDLSTFAAAYGIQNMVNAAQAFDGIRPAQGRRGDTDKDNFFYGLYDLNASELSLALLQSSGEIHAFALSDARDGWEAGVATVRSASANGDRNFWIDVSGADVEVDQDAIGSAYDGSTRDIWVGSDVYENEYVTLGVGVGVSSSEVSTVNSGNADTDTTSLVAYMRGKYGAFEYDGLFSINRSEIETTRAVALSTGSVSNTSTSTAKGNVLSGKIGYRHDVKADTLTGLAWLSGDVSSTKTDTFTEEGSSVTGLTIAGNSVKAANVGLGYTLNGSIGEGELAGANWSLGASVSEQISRGMPDVSRTASLHGANWNVSVPKAGDMTKSLRAGLVIPVEDNAGVSFNVSADKRAGSLSKAVSFGIFAQW